MATVEQRLERLERSQKRYWLVPIIVVMLIQIMAGNVRAEIVQGDFDGNGVVDFSDFLVFAGNFGKTGDKFDPNAIGQTVVYDTVKVYVQELITVAPPEDGVISGLASLTIRTLRENWDGDLSDDGIGIGLWLRNASGGTVELNDAEKAIEVVFEVSVWEADIVVLTEKYTGKIGTFFVGGGNAYFDKVFKIEREKLEPFESRRFDVTVKLITPKQGTFEDIGKYALISNDGNNKK